MFKNQKCTFNFNLMREQNKHPHSISPSRRTKPLTPSGKHSQRRRQLEYQSLVCLFVCALIFLPGRYLSAGKGRSPPGGQRRKSRRRRRAADCSPPRCCRLERRRANSGFEMKMFPLSSLLFRNDIILTKLFVMSQRDRTPPKALV